MNGENDLHEGSCLARLRLKLLKGAPMGQAEPRLSVRLLGTFSACRGEEPIQPEAWGKPKTASLFKYLLLRRDEVVPTDQLIDALYPDSDPAKIRKDLTGRISQLRRTLEPDLERGPDSRFVETCNEGYRFRSDACWVDVAAFERALDEADSLREGKQWGQAVGRYREALGHYGGDLLPDEPYAEWALEPREWLREQHRRALEGAAICHVHLARYPDAIRHLEQLLSDEPTRESAVRWLMLAHHFHGAPEKARSTYAACEAALRSELDAEPTAETQQLFSRIERGKVAAPKRSRPHNLPEPMSSFVGRADDLAEVGNLLDSNRLVTLTGVGGIGKTRLALELARTQLDEYADGVWWVDLAPLAEPRSVPQAVATALGLREASGQTIEATLAAELAANELLLVLDNGEHVVEAAASLVARLLAASPDLTVLATSRRPLEVPGEAVWPMPLLDLPEVEESPNQMEDAEAVRLFVDRARAARPGFALTEANAASVARICRQLEGVPLAVELAATQVRALAPEQIQARLRERFERLGSGPPAAGTRHQSLEAALEWSYQLLAPEEQSLLRRLAIFRGGFTTEAAEAVCAGHGVDCEAVVPALTGLVEQSLVRFDGTRYRLLEPVRQFGETKLGTSNAAERTRQRHLAYFLRLAEAAEEKLDGPDQTALFRELDAEHDNVRAALAWALRTEKVEQALRLAWAFARFWHNRGHWTEGRRWLEQVLQRREAASRQIQAKVLHRFGQTAALQGDNDNAQAALDEGLAMFRELGDRRATGYVLKTFGMIKAHEGKRDEARRLAEEALAIARDIGDEFLAMGSLNNLGVHHNEQGDLATARQRFEECRAKAAATGNRRTLALSIFNLGKVANYEGQSDQARQLFEESLRHFRELDMKPEISGLTAKLGVLKLRQGNHEEAFNLLSESLAMSWNIGHQRRSMFTLSSLASAFQARGQAIEAAQLQGAATAALEQIDTVLEREERDLYERTATALQEALGDDGYKQAFEAGQALSLEEAIERATSDDSTDAT